MRVKIEVIAVIVKLGRAARPTLIATKRYLIGLVQQLYNDINVVIVYFKINGAV